MKISVIIPSYKPQDWIYECLSSLAGQTFEKAEFEVIIVLNGCCEPYKSELLNYICTGMRGVNVNLIQTDQAGVSNARNIGIGRSKGEYIAFIDDDDFVSDSYLADLYAIASTGHIPLSNFLAFEEDADTRKYTSYYITDTYNRLGRKGHPYQILPVRSYLSVPCAKLIPRKVIADRRFYLDFKNGEDSIFMFLISDEMKTFEFTEARAIYYRRIREGSAVTRKKKRKEVLANSCKREFDIIQNIVSCPSLTKHRSMAGFFSKKQYAAMADRELAMKLLKERCLECSICAIFFNSSLTVSIKARFLSRILSATLIREFFMLFFTLVISCMPPVKRFSNSA